MTSIALRKALWAGVLSVSVTAGLLTTSIPALAADPTPQATATSTSTETSAPTSTAAAQATPAPAPTATASPEPTTTAKATPTQTATAKATPTPTATAKVSPAPAPSPSPSASATPTTESVPAQTGPQEVSHKTTREVVYQVKIKDMSWEQTRTKIFAVYGTGFEGNTVHLQLLKGSSWTTVKKSPILQNNNTELTYRFNQEGTGTFRAIVVKDAKTKAVSPTIKSTHLKRATTVQAVNAWNNIPFSVADGSIPAGTQRSTTYQVYNGTVERTGVLQELRSGSWVTIQTVKFNKASGWKATVKSPKSTQTVFKKYRFVIRSSDEQKSWTSPISKIEHMNPAHYTGYKKAAYNYMKPWCSSQVIKLIDGYASYAYAPSYKIKIATSYGTGKYLKYVSLHECAHIVSYKLYEGDWDTMNRRMNQIYGSSPAGAEQLADCMAYAMGAEKSAGGVYTASCSGYRGEAARKVLAGIRP